MVTRRGAILLLAAGTGCAPVAPAPVTRAPTPAADAPTPVDADAPVDAGEPTAGGRSGGSFYSTALHDVDRYFGVEYPSHAPSKCSPRQPEDVKWRGVVIQGPRRVEFTPGKRAASGRFAVVPVCGLYTVDMAKLMDGKAMQVVAIDTATKRELRGAVVEVDEGIEAPPPATEPLDPSVVRAMALGGHFNIDVTQYVALPERAATYEIVVEYGGLRSNPATIYLVAV